MSVEQGLIFVAACTALSAFLTSSLRTLLGDGQRQHP
jgi:hypothetical protein